MAIMLLTQTSVEWFVYEVFLYTKLFTGPEQFLIQLLLPAILPDMYFMLYCPYMWIRASQRDKWTGWGQGRKEKHFYFVRKPDPREELTRQGYFVKLKKHPSVIENIIRLQCDHSVYKITELKRASPYSWSSQNVNYKEEK